MSRAQLCGRTSTVLVLVALSAPAAAQSFRVQCPTSTITHPSPLTNVSAEPPYVSPTTQANTANGYLAPTANVNGAIKCQQISGGDGYATMADGTQTFMFSFGPLSGLYDISRGLPGTQFPNVFNTVYPGTILAGDPATTDGASDYAGAGGAPGYSTGNTSTFTYNGAVGLQPDQSVNTFDPTTGASILNCTLPVNVSNPACLTGHVDPRQILDVGVMNGNLPAPLMAFDEDDEFFLTLTNVGMIMRPDLFEQHTVHFHGYPNASSFYDGVPDASIAINIGGSFTYYYLAPDAGTYFWHCHITPPEHLQMGMVGQLYVRPRQNRVPAGDSLYLALAGNAPLASTTAGAIGSSACVSPATCFGQQSDLRTTCNSAVDILCSNPPPATANMVNRATGGNYAYNDGDGSTYYDVEYPLQIHGFDPNFHFVGMTFNPEAFADMKDKFFLLNGRSYPDTVSPGPQMTQSSDQRVHFSQPLPSVITITHGQRALLRISDLDVSEFQTLASLGIVMHVIGYNAKLLRDQAGNNLDYYTNSITLGGGESLDVILDTCTARSVPSDPSSTCTTPMPTGVYYLFTPNLDHMSNDAENFGGLMTEVHVN